MDNKTLSTFEQANLAVRRTLLTGIVYEWVNLILVLLWANKIIVENPFPNVLRRSRVVNVRERILNPFEVTIFLTLFPDFPSFQFRWRVKLYSWRPPKFIEFWRYGSDKSVSKDSAATNSPSSRPKLQQRLDLKQLELLLQGSISPSVFFFFIIISFKGYNTYTHLKLF